MHYYQFHIADFNQSTKHLSLVERAIYRELIDLYYDKEESLPGNTATVARLIMAREYLTDVEQVLNEFFTLVDDRWTNVKCEEVLDDYKNKLNNASKAGKASARARAKSRKASSDVTTVERPLNDRGTNHKPLTINHKPITKGKDSKSSKIPYSAIAESYNRNFADQVEGRGDIEEMTPARKTACRKLWNKVTESDNEKLLTNRIDYWDRYFTHCAGVPFLTGVNDRNWRASFDTLVNHTKYIKILEGEYE